MNLLKTKENNHYYLIYGHLIKNISVHIQFLEGLNETTI